ncbi:MAG: helix-turn-helix transcriptional regulator [Chitinispirillaceae bacterium]|nr:helix-turn-helix transcriptional regulator [Chitinispirillaceae bacterium]
MSAHGSDIGRNIRNLRKEKGLSQAELARKTGVTQKVISAYERSYRLPPSTFIPRVAETLGTTPDALYDTGEGKSGGLKKNSLWKIVERLEGIPESERDKVFAMIDKYLKSKYGKKVKKTGKS